MNYTVSANGRRLEVMDDSETVSYTTSGLIYGEVQVSAINTCGQESQPATINIPAAGTYLPCIIVHNHVTRGLRWKSPIILILCSRVQQIGGCHKVNVKCGGCSMLFLP